VKGGRPTADLLSRVALALAVYAFFAATDSQYRAFAQLYPLLNGFALVGLVALGLGVTMIAGELDLSVGSMAAVAGIIAVYASDWGVVPCLVVAVAAAAAFGAAQGFAIALLRINSLVFTIGTLIALRGFAFVISHEQSVLVNLDNLSISDSITRKLWIFSPFSLITITAFVVIGGFMAYTRSGRQIYAIGGGRSEALGAGVSSFRPIVVVFTISAGLAGLAGSLASLQSGAAQPGAFDSLLLGGVTAALVGGVSLYGGKGSFVGVAVGVLTLRFLVLGISSRGWPFYVESLATGALLLAVLLVELATSRGGELVGTLRRRTEIVRDVGTLRP
jgi:ribose/xylose/arabinose/galactoside ABC-type transport system permease subunit